MTKLEANTKQLTKVVSRLKEVLEQPKDEIVRDSAIKRFELAMDVAWKTLKTYLEERDGIVVHSPTNTIKEAYKQGYIEYDNKWLEFVKMRNETAHIYKEDMSEEVYSKLPDVLTHLQALLAGLEKNGESAD